LEKRTKRIEIIHIKNFRTSIPGKLGKNLTRPGGYLNRHNHPTSIHPTVQMSVPVSPAEFESSNLSLGSVKTVEIEKQGKKQVMGKKAFVNYNKGKLTLQSALNMRVPFGLSVYEPEGGGAPKYSLNLAFDDMHANPEVKAFHDAVAAIDEFVLEQALENSEAWFGKKKGREALEDNYSATVKYSKKDTERKYAPTMKINLRTQVKDGSFEVKLFDVKGNPYPDMPLADILGRNARVTAAIDCTDIWIGGNGKFNVRWNVTQLVIHSTPSGSTAGCSIKLPAGLMPAVETGGGGGAAAAAHRGYDDEEGEEDNRVEDEPVFTKPSVIAAMMPAAAPAAAADDEEDDEEDMGAPPPPKKPVALKKKPVLAAKRT
jgi:hypothetical protein